MSAARDSRRAPAGDATRANRNDNVGARGAALVYGAATSVGLVRPHNEDSYVVRDPLFAVCDGMGGHNAGEVASAIAVETLTATAPRTADAAALRDAVIAANRAVIRGAHEGAGREGMGTTLTAAVIEGDRLVVAQVGDSRAYLLHNGHLQQITRDHSFVAELVDSGQITEAEARVHPKRSLITRALGSDPGMLPDIYHVGLTPGDRLLLCSDGLSGMVEDHHMEAILLNTVDAQSACNALIDAANAGGGLDNITCIVVDINRLDARATTVKRAERSDRKRIIRVVCAFLAALLVAYIGIVIYAHSNAYLIDEGGTVAIYRGVPGKVLGMEMSWLVEDTGIPVDELRSTTQERLKDGIAVGSLDNADDTVASYRNEINQAKGLTDDTASISDVGDTDAPAGSDSTGATR